MNTEFGNLEKFNIENPDKHGWFLGSFIPKSSLLHSESCEVKWARHKKGLKKSAGKELSKNTKTAVILLSGKWKTIFPERNEEIILSKQGDYLVYKGQYHENEAIEDSHIIVIRWAEK